MIEWWKSELFLNELLPFINKARAADNAIDRCESLCKALNKTWNEFYKHRIRHDLLNATEQEKGRSDTQSFRELMLNGIAECEIQSLCESSSLATLANFDPRIMNHDTLLKKRYDPHNIEPTIVKKATDEHCQMANALARFITTPDDIELRERLLRKLQQLIYLVRSNIAHSEKTPRGPDIEKHERDEFVSVVTANVIDRIFDALLFHPSHRLVVYGTLAPGKANSHRLQDFDGCWIEAQVGGQLREHDGFVEFVWKGPKRLPVQVLTSLQLPQKFADLDRFEGPRYLRILVPIVRESEIYVANIYAAV